MLAAKVENLPWIKDGIKSRVETSAVLDLTSIADVNPGLAEDLMEQSWVIEGRNHPALEALWRILAEDMDVSNRVLSHPAIADGISEKEAKVVPMLRRVGLVDEGVPAPDLVDRLLDPGQTFLEERTITLPLAGETELTIVRMSNRNPQALDVDMDTLEHSVRSIEEFMGYPFPRRQVILWNVPEEDGHIYYDAGHGGAHHGTYMAVVEGGSEEGISSTAAHETAHYYWGGAAGQGGVLPWLNEGGAVFVDSAVSDALDGSLTIRPCGPAKNIKEWERLTLGLDSGPGRHICNYALGERLFRDLYRSMDETTFRLAFRALYLRHYVLGSGCQLGDTACVVRDAFGAYAPESTKVVARWYDGSEPYNLSEVLERLEGPVKPDIAAINGRIEGLWIQINGLSEGPTATLEYVYCQNPGDLESSPIETWVYYEDGFWNKSEWPLHNDCIGGGTLHDLLGHETAPEGRYWVFAYWREQKIAELAFELVLPSYRVRGTLTGPDSQVARTDRIGFKMEQEDLVYWSNAVRDGAFEASLPAGSFVVTAHPHYSQIWGWRDSNGGITTKIARINIDGTDAEGLNITIPANAEIQMCQPALSGHKGLCDPLDLTPRVVGSQ